MIMPRLCSLWRGTVPAAHPWGRATILSVKMLPIKLNNCRERVFNKFCVFAICNANKCARFEYPKYCHEYRILCISTNEYIYRIYVCSCTHPLSNRFHRLHEDYALYLICCQSSTIAANSICKVCNENLSAKADSRTYSKNKGCVQPWDRARPAAAQVESSIYFLYFFPAFV